MDFVTGARMHVCIAAFSSGIPVVPLSYSRKFNGLFSALGYSLIADAKVMTTDLAYETIVEGFRERAELARHVALGNRIAQEKLECYEGFIVQSLNVYGSFIKETDFDKVQST
jgi:polysaccharide pyruvyl transferase WcaK-like protein